MPAIVGCGQGGGFYRQREGHAETAQSGLTVIMKLVISGLSSVTLIVKHSLSLVLNLFVPISLRLSSKNCGRLSWPQSGHDVVNFSHLGEASVSGRQLTGYSQNIIYRP